MVLNLSELARHDYAEEISKTKIEHKHAQS